MLSDSWPPHDSLSPANAHLLFCHRLARIAFLGFGIQALVRGQGALGSLAQFSNSFGLDLEGDFESIERAVDGGVQAAENAI